MKLLRKLRAFFRKDTLNRELSEELRTHLEMQAEANLAAGLSPTEARDEAQRQFGHVEGIKERVRDQRGLRWLDELLQDFRYGLRQLRKAPGFSAVCILTLAIGIGACTAIFSAINGVLLRPLAYPDSGQLVIMEEIFSRSRGSASPGAFADWRRQAKSFSDLAASQSLVYHLTGSGDPIRVWSSTTTPNYFSVLGVRPMLGRDFRPDEAAPGRQQVVILSHLLWTTRFAARPDILDQAILLDDQVYTIIGVMPPDFQPDGSAKVTLYTPLGWNTQQMEDHGSRTLGVIGRLKPDVTLAQATAEMTVISQRIAQQYPATNRDWRANLLPLLEATVRGYRPMLLILLGAVGALLLMACVNIANLLLVRASSRHKEIVLRATLGASRGRIVRQLLCENLLIAWIGGACGIGLSQIIMNLLSAIAPPLPRGGEVAIDGTVLAFSCGLTLLTGLAFGVAPALQATRVNLNESLKDGGRGSSDSAKRQRLRSVLVATEVALALMLLVTSGLFINSFARLLVVDPGFQPAGVYWNRLVFTPRHYPTEPDRVRFADRLGEQLAALPEVEAFALTTGLPFNGGNARGFAVAGRAADPREPWPPAWTYSTTPDYFKVLQVPLKLGRLFSAGDGAASPPVVVISEELARRYFPNEDPLGNRVALQDSPAVWREVVGVVGDVKQNGLQSEPMAQLYVPFAQRANYTVSTFLIVRTRGAITGLGTDLSAAIHAVDKNMPVDQPWPLADSIKASLELWRFSSLVFSGFSVVALIIAVIGIYGVMAFSVGQRTHEIGIRMALGAQSRDVLRLILGNGSQTVGLGLLLGTLGALATSRLLTFALYGVTPYDPLTFAAVAVLLALVAFLACWLPARKAAKVDPLVALRHE